MDFKAWLKYDEVFKHGGFNFWKTQNCLNSK